MNTNKARRHIPSFGKVKALRKFGIDFLTGEADATGLRGLFDLNEYGCDIVTEFFGGAHPEADGWNNGVKSVFIPYSAVTDLLVFCLLRDGYNVVVTYQSDNDGISVNAYTDIEQCNTEIDRARTIISNVRKYYRSGTSQNGLSNVHVFSGRTQ